MYYTHTDYLGSYQTITNELGNVVEELSFGPCLPVRNAMEAGGRRRNPTDWTYNNVPTTHLFDRGFTGHEHLDNFDLINMNGRMYDPWLGRFLSPDNYVQAPTYSQNFNRYSYVMNNPLKYTDPDGEFAVYDDVIAIVVGGVINVAVNWKYINEGGKFNLGRAALSFGIGAIAGEAALYTGGATAGLFASGTSTILVGAVSGAAAGTVGGFTTGSGNAWIQGASFKQGLESGVKGAIWGGAGGAVLGGIAGWVSTTSLGQKINDWDFISSKGRFFNYKNPYSPFYNNGKEGIITPEPIEFSSKQPKGGWDKNYTSQSSSIYNGKIVTNPEGEQVTISIPQNYIPEVARNGNGLVYRVPGSRGNANIIKIMGSTSYAPNGYAVFYNSYGQPYNPINGMTLSKANWHFLFK